MYSFSKRPVGFIRSAAVVLASLMFSVAGFESAMAQSTDRSWWNDVVEQRLQLCGENQSQIVTALNEVPYEHQRAMQFLVQYMPESDLKTLSAEYLLDNVRLAYQAINEVPWGKQIPESVFFNDVLPYANVDETREAWRLEMMERCLPLIKDCKNPGEAAQKLNRELFPLIKVRYATSRNKANQSPSESIDQSVASCTGLSILLSDACRSVGVPARLAGIPSWTNKRGNHTWVEVWDQQWHFTGAAEPSNEGLNHGWFAHDASLANDEKVQHRIYATSFAETGLHFPMVWANGNKSVPAVNVTGRYTQKKQAIDPNETRVLITIVDEEGKRVERDVQVTSLSAVEEGAQSSSEGRTKGESADTNDYLTLKLRRNMEYEITWQEGEKKLAFRREAGDDEQSLWRFQLEK